MAAAGHRGDHQTARAALADPDPSVRATALGALVRCGALTADLLDAALADPHPVVRRRAAEEAVHVPAVDLAAALTDTDSMVVEAAAWACGERERPGSQLIDPLVRVATHHSDPLCREAAVAALGAIGDPAGLPAILAGCGDRAAVRRRAVLALAPFDGPEVDAALAAAAEDRDWQVRQAAEDLLEDPEPRPGGTPLS